MFSICQLSQSLPAPSLSPLDGGSRRDSGHYANAHEHDYAKVQQKRAMGAALAATIIHGVTPTHADWGDRQYPLIAERLTTMISGYSLPELSPSDEPG